MRLALWALLALAPGLGHAVDIVGGGGGGGGISQATADGLYINDDASETKTAQTTFVDSTTFKGNVLVDAANLKLSSGPFYIDGSGSLRLGAAGTSLFMDMSVGRLGLGTLTPGAKLHVSSGAVIIDGTGNLLYVSSASFLGSGGFVVTTSSGIRIGGGGPLQLDAGGSIVFPDGTTQTTAPSGAGGWTDDGTVVRLTTLTDSVVIASTVTISGVNGKLGVADVNTTLTLSGSSVTVRGELSAKTITSTVTISGTDGKLGVADINTALTLSGSSVTVRGELSAATITSTVTIKGADGRLGVATIDTGLTNTSSVTLSGTSALLRVSTSGVAGSAAILTDSSNRVAVGHNSPTAALHVRTGAGDFVFSASTTSTAAAGLHVDGDGQVGVGLSNPVHPLDVASTYEANSGACFHPNTGACGVTNGMLKMLPVQTDGKAYMTLLNNNGTVFEFGSMSTTFTQFRGNTTAGTRGLEVVPEGTVNYSFLVSSPVTSGNPHFVVTTPGRVGVGMIDPGTKFHMSSGTLTVDGNTAAFQLSSGTAMLAFFKGQFTKDCAQVNLATVGECSAVVTGINDNDTCDVGAKALETGLSVSFSSASLNVIAFRLTNPTVGNIDPASQTFTYSCFRSP